MNPPPICVRILGRIELAMAELSRRKLEPGWKPLLIPAQVKTWDDLLRHWWAEELLGRPAMDRLSRILARERVCSRSASTDQAQHMAWRLLCARDFLATLFPPPSQRGLFPDLPQDWSETEILEWLLVDLWHSRADSWLKLTAIAQTGPFEFYGLENGSGLRPDE